MIRIKRAYEAPALEDGQRVLVERLWPRGVKKEALAVESWAKDVAPSTELRKWFAHQVERWEEFQRRYRAELDSNPAAWEPLRDAARRGALTLVYSAQDTEHNSAVVLRDYLEERMRPARGRPAQSRAAQAGPARTRRAKARATQARSVQTRPAQARPARARRTRARATRARSARK